MAALFDEAKINNTGLRAELYEDGVVWIIDDVNDKSMKINCIGAANLLAFLEMWAKVIHDAERMGRYER